MTYVGPERRKLPSACQVDVLSQMQSMQDRILDLQQSLKLLVELKQRDHTDMLKMHQSNTDLLAQLSMVVRGNGKPGLVERVHDVETLIAYGKWVIGAAVIFMVQQVLSFFFHLAGKG